MNPNVINDIEKCAHESHAGLLTFPEVLVRLFELDVVSYFADYRNQSTSYYLSNNEAHRVTMVMPPVLIPNFFNKEQIVSAIRAAQSDLVRYPKFVELTMSAGCVGYIVWISGRHASYFGRDGQVHIEHFPKA